VGCAGAGGVWGGGDGVLVSVRAAEGGCEGEREGGGWREGRAPAAPPPALPATTWAEGVDTAVVVMVVVRWS
jgi:hypothetical protein